MTKGLELVGPFTVQRTPRGCLVRGRLEIHDSICFRIRLEATGSMGGGTALSAEVPWLPRGTHDVCVKVDAAESLAAGGTLVASWVDGMSLRTCGDAPLAVGANVAVDQSDSWAVNSLPPAPPADQLSWRKGEGDWFFRHFDHAAPTVISYLLGDHPLLKGRILDVGCGDGITDLGIALRTKCEELVGIDPFSHFEALPRIVADNHLPADVMPRNLRFMAEDANFLPFPDDAFDVVLSWGSIEHMAGGYLQALREMKRVLKPDGLLMVAPGLFYSNIGHHLGEFSSEPFFHLKKPREELRRMVLSATPQYIDQSGRVATPEEYWQWFTELNPITVAGFEKEMRALEFRPWRIALRTDPLVEYTPEIEHYPIQDLANVELYSSWINRKRRRAE